MGRLIDADALMECLKQKKCEPAKVRYTEGFNDALMRFRSMIHNAPTVEERKHGHWAWDNDEEVWKCSNCESGDDFLISKYCKDCGAKMDEVR